MFDDPARHCFISCKLAPWYTSCNPSIYATNWRQCRVPRTSCKDFFLFSQNFSVWRPAIWMFRHRTCFPSIQNIRSCPCDVVRTAAVERMLSSHQVSIISVRRTEPVLCRSAVVLETASTHLRMFVNQNPCRRRETVTRC